MKIKSHDQKIIPIFLSHLFQTDMVVLGHWLLNGRDRDIRLVK